jgi:hypothetical protein
MKNRRIVNNEYQRHSSGDKKYLLGTEVNSLPAGVRRFSYAKIE